MGDVCDNCAGKINNDQLNTDQDRFGDICDDDVDNDGLNNVEDNCQTVANPSQSDSDNDTVRSFAETKFMFKQFHFQYAQL